jgi:aminoglycoside phosphotransferase (APT) family kinase protein
VTARAETSDIPGKLVAWLGERMPRASDIAISDWHPAERGFSTETVLFDLRWREDGEERTEGLVFRRPPAVSLFPDYDLLRQFLVMKRLRGTSVPVPEPRWIERGDALIGTPFLIMSQVSGGITASDAPPYHSAGVYLDATPEQRAQMWWGCVDLIAKIHKVDRDAKDFSFLELPGFGATPVEQAVNYVDRLLDWAKTGPQPVLDAGMEWLHKNAYEPEHVTLCWGDSRMSNVLYTGEFEVLVALDWETAFIGDHEADLAWMLFLDWANSEGTGIARLEGTPSEQETIVRYEELTGWSLRNLRFNKILAACFLACVLLRLTTVLRDVGAIGDDLDLSAFCSAYVAGQLDE